MHIHHPRGGAGGLTDRWLIQSPAKYLLESACPPPYSGRRWWMERGGEEEREEKRGGDSRMGGEEYERGGERRRQERGRGGGEIMQYLNSIRCALVHHLRVVRSFPVFHSKGGESDGVPE